MTYPDTFELAAGRMLQRIIRGGLQLASPPTHFEEDAEQRDFRLAAQAGAVAYAKVLTEKIDDGRVTDLDLQKAELIALTTEGAGWITPTGAPLGREEAIKDLVAEGSLVFYLKVPGRYAACYRLQAPC